jgi:hypothetical protein
MVVLVVAPSAQGQRVTKIPRIRPSCSNVLLVDDVMQHHAAHILATLTASPLLACLPSFFGLAVSIAIHRIAGSQL